MIADSFLAHICWRHTACWALSSVVETQLWTPHARSLESWILRCGGGRQTNQQIGDDVSWHLLLWVKVKPGKERVYRVVRRMPFHSWWGELCLLTCWRDALRKWGNHICVWGASRQQEGMCKGPGPGGGGDMVFSSNRKKAKGPPRLVGMQRNPVLQTNVWIFQDTEETGKMECYWLWEGWLPT